jgi:hypothetical protein
MTTLFLSNRYSKGFTKRKPLPFLLNWIFPRYLMQLIGLGITTHLGFALKWTNWISSLWNTSSSSIILNGEPDKRIIHYRGVR